MGWIIAVTSWIILGLFAVPFRRRTKLLERIAFDHKVDHTPYCADRTVAREALHVLYETSFIWDEDDDIRRASRT